MQHIWLCVYRQPDLQQHMETSRVMQFARNFKNRFQEIKHKDGKQKIWKQKMAMLPLNTHTHKVCPYNLII